jgi:hypothetical protein
VNAPVSEFKDSILKDDNKAIGLLVKVDPTKEIWGDIKIFVHVKSKYGGSTIINSSNYTGSAYVTSNAYGTTKSYSGGVAASTSVDETYYQPAGGYVPTFGTSDVKVACNKCGHLCDYGQDYCDKCGESTKDDSVYENYYDASTA